MQRLLEPPRDVSCRLAATHKIIRPHRARNGSARILCDDQALDFNIHFHLGKQVSFPERQKQVQRAQGELTVSAPQDHCWMWSNRGASAGTLSTQVNNNHQLRQDFTAGRRASDDEDRGVLQDAAE